MKNFFVKKRNNCGLFVCALILCTATFTTIAVAKAVVSSYSPEKDYIHFFADNDSGYAQTESDFCTNCPAVYNSDKVESSTGTTVEITINGYTTSINYYEKNDSCYGGRICQPSGAIQNSNIPSPAYEDESGVHTNESYQKQMDEMAKYILTDDGNHFDTSNIYAQGIMKNIGEQYGITDPDAALDKFREIMSENQKNGKAKDEGIAMVAKPYLTITEGGEVKTAYYGESHPGVDNVVNVVGKSSKAGSSEKDANIKKGQTGNLVIHSETLYRGENDKDFDFTVPEITLDKPIDFKPLEKQNLGGNFKPDDKPGNLSCGQNYNSTMYSYSEESIDSCGKAKYIVETNILINAPTGTGGMAGQTVNFGISSSDVTVTQTSYVAAGGSMELKQEWMDTFVEIANIEGYRAKYKSEMEVAQQKVKKLETALQNCEQQGKTCKEQISCTCSCPPKDEHLDKEPECGCDEQIKACQTTKTSECDTGVTDCKKTVTTENGTLEAAKTELQKATDTYNNYVEETEEDYQKYTARHDELQGCILEYENARQEAPKMQQLSGSEAGINISNPSLTVDGQTQASGSAVAVNKGSSGTASTSITDNSIPIQSGNFYLPANSSGEGTLNQKVSIDGVGEFDISCPLNIVNPRNPGGGGGGGCTEDCKPPTNNPLNLVYRTISLTNPFPNALGTTSRERLITWKYDTVVDNVITNNRGVDTYDVYNLTPMYTIVLTPSSISEIRKYNKAHAYNDYTLECTKGLYCKSTFLREKFINLIDSGQSCGLDGNWYACDKSTSVTAFREKLLKYLK